MNLEHSLGGESTLLFSDEEIARAGGEVYIDEDAGRILTSRSIKAAWGVSESVSMSVSVSVSVYECLFAPVVVFM